jgi:hypothetical protein
MNLLAGGIALFLLAIGTTPAAAQIAPRVPTAHPCYLALTGLKAWSAPNRFTCSTVQIETRSHRFDVRPPNQPPFTVYVYEIRARRVLPPIGQVGDARVTVTGGNSPCSVSPPTTGWTNWAACSHGFNAPRPTRVELFGLGLW